MNILMSYSHVTLNLISYVESTQCSCVMRNLFTDTFNVHGLAVITIYVFCKQKGVSGKFYVLYECEMFKNI